MKKWFKIQSKDDDSAEITIFGDIGESFFYESVSLSDFKAELDKVRDKKEIRVMLNSPGGSVFDGMAIYNLLSGVRQKVTVEVLGMAASAASVIALSGRELVMGEGSYLMIHNPWSFAFGEAEELRKTADVLDKIRDQMVDLYAAHSAMTDEEIVQAMAEETWYTATEAVEAGFADRAEDYGEAELAASYDISKYKYAHVPSEMLETGDSDDRPASVREFEARVRDMGFSKREATSIASHGFAHRDDESEDAPEVEVGNDPTDPSASILTLLQIGA